MAVATTGAIYKSLSFDGMESRNFGVYITGEAVYNAPTRDVEMVSIPGRSGSFALDKGRFENLEVTYPAGIFADNEADFARAISDFRNYLCSRKGYCRLVDEYNPDEYRMAIYKSGLEVSPAQLRAGEFNIVFDCKPQRWLTSGEAAVTVTSGDTLTNPTLFESSPLLEVEGRGTIAFNGYEITFDDGLFGDTVLVAATQINARVKKFSLPSSVYASGDTMTFDGASVNWEIRAGRGHTITAENVTAQSGATTSVVERTSLSKLRLKTIFTGTTFTAGTTYADEATATVQLTEMGGATASVSVKISFTYNATNEAFTFVFLETAASSGFGTYHDSTIMKELSVDSTVYALGHPTYIDCDLGDAYRIDNGVYTSLNSHIDLGSDLPKLASGANEITYDNTITELKIHPRWWKV